MTRFSAPAVAAFMVVLLVTSPLFCGQRIAFRDLSHFYLPLFDYIDYRTESEWLPLWNPLDQTGMPLVGESSTCVLYPIRYLIYSLPLSSVGAMNLFLVAHLLLASLATFWLGSRLHYTPFAIFAAAITYPLSGSVYSLTCNPPFLVGAAWLPLAIGALIAVKNLSTRYRVVLGSLALSMMILGGDPQTALHVILVTTVWGVARAMASRLSRKPRIDPPANGAPGLRQLVGPTVLASLLALLMSALQVAASVDWSRQSDRAAKVTQRRDQYDFSLAPWHTCELVCGRPFGAPFPVNARISRVIPGDGRMWTPSLYAGLIVGLALFCRVIRPRAALADPWWILTFVSLLTCFGHFGVVWILQQIPGWLSDWDSAVGGPYWILNQLIPGYGAFRFPVKWLPFFALSAAMVTGSWLSEPRQPAEKTSFLLVGVFSLVCLALCHHFSGNVDELALPPADDYWGPSKLGLGFIQARNAWGISFTMVVLVGWIRFKQAHGSTSVQRNGLTLLFAALIALDCGWHASVLLPQISVEEETRLARRLTAQVGVRPLDNDALGHRYLRTQAGQWPKAWQSSSSTQRALEVAVSERLAWLGRWHLAERSAVFNSITSIRSKRIDEFWHAVHRDLRGMNAEQRKQYWIAVRCWLSIDSVLHSDGGEEIRSGDLKFVKITRVTNLQTAPFRVHTRWRPEQSLAKILDDLKQSSDSLLPCVALDQIDGLSDSDLKLEMIDRDSAEVHSQQGCLLERCQFQDGNWCAVLTSTDGQTVTSRVYPSSHLLQAVWVPPGDWVIRFEYRPWWKTPAITLTGLGWAIWLAVCWVNPRTHRVSGD